MSTISTKEDTLLRIWSETQGAESEAYEGDLQELHRAMGIRRRQARRPWLFGAIAASILFLAMAGEYLITNKHARTEEIITYVTSPSSKGEFILPDGSHVWLNSSSALSFHQSNPRNVKLEGEGFFDVAKKDDGQAFTVNTGAMSIKVLGTRFNVRSSSHFEREEVSLVSGRVEINAGDNTITLSPGEKAGIENGILQKENADITYDSSWTQEELSFDNAALSDIIAGMEHWFNVNIRVAPDVPLSSRLSFKIVNESLEETQRIITRITGCRFKTLDEQNIMITKR